MGIDSALRKELIRQGSVFDAYCLFEKDKPKYILKTLKSQKFKFREKYENEGDILEAISGKKGYSQLVFRGSGQLAINYIDHKDYTESEKNNLLAEQPILRERLVELLYQYNSVKMGRIIKDRMLLNVIKATGKGLLKRKINLKTAFYSAKSILFEAVAFKDKPILLHNDFTCNNVLIDSSNEIYIIDYDRGTTSCKFVYRDVLNFLLRSQVISDWTWQYDFFKKYYLNMDLEKSISQRKFQANIYYTCIRICMFYIYNSNPENILLQNLKYLFDKDKASSMLDILWQEVNRT